MSLTRLESGRTVPTQVPPPDRGRPVDWRRLRSPVAAWALVLCAIAAVGTSLGSLFAGRLAEHATAELVWQLATCVVGAAVLDTAARTLWAGVVDRAEGTLRADLLDAALHQPLPALTEQAVGEVLDRVDDDTHEVGTLLRQSAWQAIRTLLASGPLWVVAGTTWWPAFLLFPLAGAAALAAARPLLPALSARKVEEEKAWTDHAAAMEEGVAGRDDLRASLGQAHVLRRCTQLASEVHTRFADVLGLESRIGRRTGTLLHAVLAATAVVGVTLVVDHHLTTASLVTLFIVTTMFVGQIDMLARHLPDLQAGFGAVLRLRGLFDADREPVGGDELPAGPLDVEFRDLHFAYVEGRFALQHVDLRVQASTTCALVGRTGSGKSTLASLLSRAAEPERGSVVLGGIDVLDLDLQSLRSAVGVVTQRTEILAGTLAENITLFEPVPRADVERAVAELGLEAWVSGLPDGLDTLLGPGGTTLSSGEEQLVAFARLLVRNVRVVVLDEATARMDRVTETHVVRAAGRLLAGRTGLLVAHRLSTTERAQQVAVLEGGRVVQQGPRARVATQPGPFRSLLEKAVEEDASGSAAEPALVPDQGPALPPDPGLPIAGAERVGTARRTGKPPAQPRLDDVPSLARATLSALLVEPKWGLVSVGLFLGAALSGAFGALTGWIWGHLVVALQDGDSPVAFTAALVVCLLASPLLMAESFRRYPRWWVSVMLRVRSAVLMGQTAQHRLERTPPGEVVARGHGRRPAGPVRRPLGRLRQRAGHRRGDRHRGAEPARRRRPARRDAGLVAGLHPGSACGRSVRRRLRLGTGPVRPLAGVRAGLRAHGQARRVDAERARPPQRGRQRSRGGGSPRAPGPGPARRRAHRDGAVRRRGGVGRPRHRRLGAGDRAARDERRHRVRLVRAGRRLGHHRSARHPRVDADHQPARRRRRPDEAAGRDRPGGRLGPAAPARTREALRTLELVGVTAVHDDGTLGATDVDLTIGAQELVLLLGQVGSGKSSLLSVLAGLVSSTGEIRWNGDPVADPQTFLRPGRVAHVAQVPRVLSGTFRDNVRLDHPDREVLPALESSRLVPDVEAAGGPDALVGHRGVRLSGGQVQRLALARALACDAELLLADDVSSALDSETEIELWTALRRRGATVIGATSKRAALAQADRVVVLVEGRVAAVGAWSQLSGSWGHLAG